jgi:hypothetical protein
MMAALSEESAAKKKVIDGLNNRHPPELPPQGSP